MAMDALATAGQSLDAVEAALRRGLAAGGTPVGAVIAEPIQGRAGIIVPPRGWFTALAELTRRYGAILVADEIFTGMGRTGEWFASEVAPDLLCLGKVLGGGFPISACIGTPEVMAAWGESTGEAIHTSTFLGSPLGCAAGLAVIEVIQNEHLIERCRALGTWLHGKLTDLARRETRVRDVRGRGLMLGLEVGHGNGTAAPGFGARIMKEALQRGVIVLPAGPRGDVVELTPPYVLSAEQATFALDVL
jgi:4-aminobutyrate aminotransferase-like enzyme